MKKVISLLFFLLIATSIDAIERVYFICEGFHNKPVGNQTPKSPMLPPLVYIDGYTLSFVEDHPEYVLSIINEENEVVYMAVVSSIQTQVILPTVLSGTYQVKLNMGNCLFVGWIDM